MEEGCGGSRDTGEGELFAAFCAMRSIFLGKKDHRERKQSQAKLREGLRSTSAEQLNNNLNRIISRFVLCKWLWS